MPRTSSTTSSEQLGLGGRCVVFLLPVIFVLGLTAVKLRQARELITAEEAVMRQEERPALFMPKFQDFRLFWPRYHLVGAILHKPEVLVLGSSRAKTFRSAFFREPKKQWNAAMPGNDFNRVGNMRRFVEALPEGSLPKTVIVDLDPWWFRKTALIEPARDFMRPVSHVELFDFAWRRGFWWMVDDFRGKNPPHVGDDFGVGTVLMVKGVGVRNGLRPDGSLITGQVGTPPTWDDLALVHEGRHPFYHDATELGADQLEELHRFLAECRKRGIRVVGVISSIQPSIYAEMKTEPRIGYYWSVPLAVAPMFTEIDAELFDFQDPATIGCEDGEFFDAMHQSEACTARMFIELTKRSPTIDALISRTSVEKMLQERVSAWDLGF